MKDVFEGYAQRLATLQESENPFARGIAWVEGEMVPLHEARIPLMDQGFQHSDLTYGEFFLRMMPSEALLTMLRCTIGLEWTILPIG